MVSSEIKNKFLQRLMKYEDNRVCADCELDYTCYTNLSFGSFICERCFFIHLSLELPEKLKHFDDSYEIEDLLKLSSGGNSALREFFSIYDLHLKAISFKYISNSAEYYKSLIQALSVNEKFDRPLLDKPTGREPSIIFDSFLESNIVVSEFPCRDLRKSGKKLSFLQMLKKSLFFRNSEKCGDDHSNFFSQIMPS